MGSVENAGLRAIFFGEKIQKKCPELQGKTGGRGITQDLRLIFISTVCQAVTLSVISTLVCLVDWR